VAEARWGGRSASGGGGTTSGIVDVVVVAIFGDFFDRRWRWRRRLLGLGQY
jgi:hypothetical protein